MKKLLHDEVRPQINLVERFIKTLEIMTIILLLLLFIRIINGVAMVPEIILSCTDRGTRATGC